MIGLSLTAEQHLADLLSHYARLGRLDAAGNLLAALDEAAAAIESDPGCGLPAPRPYPTLIRPGISWVKARRYWVAFTETTSPEIIAVFFETADIPGRF